MCTHRFPHPRGPLPLGAVLLGTALLGASCATLESTALVPETVVVANHHAGSVALDAHGTGRSMGVGPRLVSSARLEAALAAAIEGSHLFASIAPSGKAGDWRLHVDIESLDRSEPSLDMNASAVLSWSLEHTPPEGEGGGEARQVWSERIRTSARATPQDATEFDTRGRIALEAALRDNIAQALGAIGDLEL